MSEDNTASIVSAAVNPFWSQSSQELVAQLESSAEGLKSSESESRLAQVG
jgi:hypothetical protein